MREIKLFVAASILSHASSVHASPINVAVTIDGLDWAQINDANTDFSLDKMFNLCGLSGACNSSTQKGIDLTDWLVTTQSEVNNVAALIQSSV